MNFGIRSVLVAKVVALAAIALPQLAFAFQSGYSGDPAVLPNVGRRITPNAPRGTRFEPLNPNLPNYPNYTAGQAVSTATSPAHDLLLILTSGYNRWNFPSGPAAGQADPSASNEYVFVYDISQNAPVRKQVIQVPNTYAGICFDPSGTTFYVAGGVDDNVHIYDSNAGVWSERSGSPISLGHNNVGVGLGVQPAAAGIAITADGNKLIVADYYNDSISELTKVSGAWTKTGELDLRPGKIDPANAKGVAGGEYPYWVSIKENSTAYVSSIRDREIDVVDIAATPQVTARIKVTGQPNKMVLSKDGSKLYVAEDQADTVDVIDTVTNTVVQTIATGTPAGLLPDRGIRFTGFNTNSVTLSPDEKTLYVTHGGTNDVAVISLTSPNGEPAVVGLIPTSWYPTALSTNALGSYLYIVNFKSPTGSNPGNCHGLTAAETSACASTNEYNLQLIKAGFQTLPAPDAGELARLTRIVANNNHYSRDSRRNDESSKIEFIQSRIKHVIFIVKENRTYDQILGDLNIGNGEGDIAEFGGTTTPNFHKLASQFVDLDNFYDRSEVSMDGWPWTTSARAPDTVEKQTSVNYAGRGVSYDSEGTARNVNTAYPALAQRLAANPLTPDDDDVLPGVENPAAPDGPGNKPNEGYLWNGALRAGLSIRNYGFFIDLTRYELPSQFSQFSIPVLRNPFATRTQVAYASDQALRQHTDIYFRGFDTNLPDYWRYKEWEREFDSRYARGGLPNLELVRFMNDHTGTFSTAIDRVDTPEKQQADNDYAVGLLVDKISHSRYKSDTLIFVIEDDSQDGPDHVDSHRSIAFIVGAYVKQGGVVVSKEYNTVDFVRTIEDVLGIRTLNLNDTLAQPMADVFDYRWQEWNYKATPSPLLQDTDLPIPAALFAGEKPVKPTHDARYWAEATKGFDFSAEDRIDFAKYNHILWKGLMGDKPYPEQPSRANLKNGSQPQANGRAGGE